MVRPAHAVIMAESHIRRVSVSFVFQMTIRAIIPCRCHGKNNIILVALEFESLLQPGYLLNIVSEFPIVLGMQWQSYFRFVHSHVWCDLIHIFFPILAQQAIDLHMHWQKQIYLSWGSVLYQD